MLLDFIICRLPLRYRKNASYIWLFSCFSQLLHYNRQHQDLEKCKKTLEIWVKLCQKPGVTLKKYFKICWQPWTLMILTRWKNAHLFRLSICSQLYHLAKPQSVDLSCKSNKSFLYERNIGLKWDMIQFFWVKTFQQKKGFTLPAPKAQR